MKFIKADLTDFIATEKYDLAICQAVLRHISEYKTVLSKMVDCVENNGKVICIEVNRRMENAGLFIDKISIDFNEKDNILKKQWTYELQEGGRDYMAGIKIPILMENLGLKDVGVRVNDFVEFISPNKDKDKYQDHLDIFLNEHGILIDQNKISNVSAINARSMLISYGIKSVISVTRN